MEIPYELSVNWMWIIVAVAVLILIVSLKNKIIRRHLNSLFGWPPEP